MKLFYYFLAILAALVCQSCATVFSGTKQKISINSVPQGAEVKIDGINQGITPVYVYVGKTLGAKTVAMKKDGYESETFVLKQKFNALTAINLLNWIGWLVDIATGAMYTYDPSYYEIQLKEQKKN